MRRPAGSDPNGPAAGPRRGGSGPSEPPLRPPGRNGGLAQRLAGIAGIAGLLLLTAAAVPLQLLARRRGWRLAATLPVWWHRRALAALGVRIRVVGHPCRDRPLLVTPNHVSWLDICLIGSLMPLSFVAKQEIAGWPLFGFLARLQRTVFIDRNRRTATAEANREIAERLAGGDAIVLFPEGTSWNGTHVLPFRSALIGAARAAVLDGGHERVWVQPLSLAFTRLDGLPLGRAERPLVAWYGDMEMIPHLTTVVLAGPIDVEIRWGEPIPFDETTDRKLLARALERAVRRMATASLTGREPPIVGLPAPAPGHALAPRRPAVVETP